MHLLKSDILPKGLMSTYCELFLESGMLVLDKYFSTNTTQPAAPTVQDTQKLVQAGFEYICEFDDVKILTRRK